MSNAILCEPQCRDEPGVTLCEGEIRYDAVVVVVFIACHAPDWRFHPQRLLKRLHGLLHAWIMRWQHPELEERTHAAVERRVLLDGAACVHGDHPQKMPPFLVPQVLKGRLFDLFCGLAIPANEFLFSKEFGEPGSRIQSGI